MEPGNLQKNLRLLTSYADSIAGICRRLDVNRQQFHRYLSGSARPSVRRMQRICDFFGVEESEILMDHTQFREIIAIRRRTGAPVDPLGTFIAGLHRINPRSTRQLEVYLGFYYTYFRPVEFPDLVLRSLISVFSRAGFVYCKTIENYSAIKRRSRRILKYTGILYHTGERIIVHEREAHVGQMMWTTVLLPPRPDQTSVMSGLTLGVSSGIGRDVACYRVIWEALGDQVDLRAALAGAGLYDLNSPVIPQDIRAAISNDATDREGAFVARPWVNALK
ncbi:helix-turn-helix domain-containing protein [Albidovulum sp.]|uniref:helix-turn-helix domain-containing protein n=1 Tax=Albidovulum sp. TaxID=1872424 RepID=UPI0039B9BB2D